MSDQPAIKTFHYAPLEPNGLNRWLVDRVKAFLAPRIIEISGNSGVLTQLLVEQGIPLHLNNRDSVGRALLKQKFKYINAVRVIHHIDFTRPDLEVAYSHLNASFATVVSLDLSTPELHETSAVENMGFLLQEGGILIMVLPSIIAPFPGMEYDIEEARSIDLRFLRRRLSSYELLSADHFLLVVEPEATPAIAPGLYAVIAVRKPLKSDEARLQ